MEKYDNTSTALVPQDIVEAEIVTKLPLTSLARFKSVSERWNSLISSNDFMKLYVQRRLKTSSIPSELFTLQFDVRDEPLDHSNLTGYIEEFLSGKNTRSGTFLSVIQKSDDDSLQECCVYNMWRSRWFTTYAPSAPYKHTLLHSAIGIDFSTDNLKYVLILQDKESNELAAQIKTYKDEHWRKLPIDTSSLEPSVKDQLIIPSFAEFYPAQVKNTLHWILGHGNNSHQILLSFDLTEETFTVLPFMGHGNGDHDGYLFTKLDDEYVHVGHGKEIVMYRVLAPSLTLLSTRRTFRMDSSDMICL